MKGKTRNALMGAAGAVLCVAVIRRGLSNAFDRNMVGTALDREEPKAMQKMKERVKGEAGDMEEIMAFCVKLQHRLEQRCHQVVRITVHDGTELVGHLFRAANQKRVVVAMHGWRSCWARDFGAVADFLRGDG